MPWMIVDYHPASLFSLRPAQTTASGGQTLLVPTAFAIKMALLRVSIQLHGVAAGRQRFSPIRDLRLALSVPEHITVLKTFVKLLRPFEAKAGEAKNEEEIARLIEKQAYPYHSTIAYREFVQFGDPLDPPFAHVVRVACGFSEDQVAEWLGEALVGINYLGKRGGFLQAMRKPTVSSELGTLFFEITQDTPRFLMGGTLQLLDDWGATMTFDHANVYHPKAVRLGKERVLRQVVLPYYLVSSSQGYSVYERIAG